MSDANLLIAAIMVPWIGAALVATLPEAEARLARGLGLVVALLEAAVLMSLLLRFDGAGAPVQLERAWSWIPSLGLRPRFGVDGLAIPSLWAVALVVPLGLLAGAAGDGRTGEGRATRVVVAALLAQGAAVGLLLARDAATVAGFWVLELVAAWLLHVAEDEDAARDGADRRLLANAPGAFALVAVAALLSVMHYNVSQGDHSFAPEDLQALLVPPAVQGVILFAAMLAAWARLGLWPLHRQPAALLERGGPSTAIQILGLGPALALVPLLRVGIPSAPLVFGEWAPPLASLGLLTLIWTGLASVAEPGRPLAALGRAATGQAGLVLLFVACATTPAWLALAMHVGGVAVAVTLAAVVLPALRGAEGASDGHSASLAGLPRRGPGLFVGLALGGAGLVGAPLLSCFPGLWTGLSALATGDSVELTMPHEMLLAAVLGLGLHAMAWTRAMGLLHARAPTPAGAAGHAGAGGDRPGAITVVAIGVALGVSLGLGGLPATTAAASSVAAREGTMAHHRRRCLAIPARELARPVEIDRVIADCRAPRARIVEAYGLELRRAAVSAKEVGP